MAAASSYNVLLVGRTFVGVGVGIGLAVCLTSYLFQIDNVFYLSCAYTNVLNV
jgi:hypothetical protein